MPWKPSSARLGYVRFAMRHSCAFFVRRTSGLRPQNLNNLQQSAVSYVGFVGRRVLAPLNIPHLAQPIVWRIPRRYKRWLTADSALTGSINRDSTLTDSLTNLSRPSPQPPISRTGSFALRCFWACRGASVQSATSARRACVTTAGEAGSLRPCGTLGVLLTAHDPPQTRLECGPCGSGCRAPSQTASA